MNRTDKNPETTGLIVSPRTITGAGIAVVIAIFGAWNYGKSLNEIHQASPQLAIEKIGELVSLKVHFADVIEFNESKALGIPWSNWKVKYAGTRVLLVARGDCSIATDLATAKVAFQEGDKSVMISLAHPRTVSARVNHDTREKGGSYLYAVNARGIEVFNPSDGAKLGAIDKAMAYAQKEIMRSCAQPAMIETARQNAEAVLRMTMQTSGWTPRFAWK